MGQIKFRVWVKEGTQPQLEGRLLPVESLEWDTKGQTLLYVISHDGNGGRWEVEIKNCKLMQYTGLHDKDGVEIYEGDIVKGKFNERFVIKYSVGMFKLRATYSENTYSVSSLYDVLGELEVIGNIYENPELLEGTN